jgi:hypothetical protein
MNLKEVVILAAIAIFMVLCLKIKPWNLFLKPLMKLINICVEGVAPERQNVVLGGASLWVGGGSAMCSL